MGVSKEWAGRMGAVLSRSGRGLFDWWQCLCRVSGEVGANNGGQGVCGAASGPWIGK